MHTNHRNHLIDVGVRVSLRRAGRSACALGVGLVSVLPALAQQSEPNAAGELEEVVISGHSEFFRPTEATSATKFNLPVHDTPQAIAVLTDDILDTFGAQNLYDISKFVAGVEGSPSTSNTNFFLGGMRARGFNLNGQSGYKVNGFSTLREFQPDLVAVERVEFLKGPSSVLYGVNGYGGTVNTVLKRPEDKFGGHVRVEGGGYDYYRVEGDVTGPITADGRLRYRLASAYQDGGSIKRGYDFERLPVFGELELALSPKTVFDVYGLWQKDESTDDFGATATLDANGKFVEPFGLSRKFLLADRDANRIERESYQVFASGRHVFDSGYNVQLKVGHTENDTRYRAMYMYNYGFAADPFVDIYYKKDHRKIRSSDAELTFGGDFEALGRPQTCLVSAEYRRIKLDAPHFAFDNLGTVDMFNPDFTGLIDNARPIVNGVDGADNQDETRKAVAAQILLRMTNRLSLLLGARYDRIAETARNFRFDPDPTDGVVVSQFDVVTDRALTHFTPRAGLVFQVTPQVNAFLSFTQGFIPQDGIKRNLRSIEPEEGDQYEAGLKGEFLGKKLGTSLTAFYVERKNVGVPDPTNGPTESFRIDGRAQEHKGIELELVGQPLDNFNVILTYAYLDAMITRDLSGATSGSAQIGAQGNRVYGSPRNSGSFFVQYEIPGGALKGLSFGAGAHYEGERTNQDSDLVAGGFEIFNLRSFTTVDANIRYFGLQNKVFGIEATNLFDEDYFQVGTDCCGGNYLQRGTSREVRAFMAVKF